MNSPFSDKVFVVTIFKWFMRQSFLKTWSSVRWLTYFQNITQFSCSIHSKVSNRRKCTHMLCHCLSFDSHWPLVKFLVNKGPLFKELEKLHHDFIHQVKLKLNHLTTIFWGKGCWCNLFFEHKHLSIVHWLSVKTQFVIFVPLFIVQCGDCTVNATLFSYPFNVCAKMQVVLVWILYATTYDFYQRGK